jgi:type I restriction enzyme S subunit
MIETKSNTKVSALMLFEQLKKERAKLIASKIILDKKDNHVYPIAVVPFKIPSHWFWCNLSDIALIQEGPGIRKHQYATSGIQFLTVTNILEGSVDLEKSKKYISKEQYENYTHFTINKGDIVTACSGGSWGKSAIYDLDDKLILNTSTLRLRFYNDLGDNRYLYYLTKTNYFKDSLSSYVTGQQPNYGYSHYSKIPIPLPPLLEQQRIAAIIDEAFAAITKAKANSKQNLKNAQELFESYLQGVFENKGVGWEAKKLKEVCDLKPQKKEARDKLKETDSVTFLPMEDLGVLNKEILGVKERQIKDVAGSYTYFADNDVLMAKITPCFENGKIGIARNLVNGIGFGSSEYIVFRTKGEIVPEYLYYFLSRNEIRNEGRKCMSGAVGHKRVSKDWIENYIIPFPKSLKEQQVIVKKLNTLSTETRKLGAIYTQKINDLEELKKSVLQKAFSGELKTAKQVTV